MYTVYDDFFSISTAFPYPLSVSVFSRRRVCCQSLDVLSERSVKFYGSNIFFVTVFPSALFIEYLEVTFRVELGLEETLKTSSEQNLKD